MKKTGIPATLLAFKGTQGEWTAIQKWEVTRAAEPIPSLPPTCKSWFSAIGMMWLPSVFALSAVPNILSILYGISLSSSDSVSDHP